jgi:hypothetical protein
MDWQMDTISYFSNMIHGIAGPWGSPIWYLIGAVVITVFLARWARAIRTLLPFFGAFALIFMIVWSLNGLGILQWKLH